MKDKTIPYCRDRKSVV